MIEKMFGGSGGGLKDKIKLINGDNGDLIAGIKLEDWINRATTQILAATASTQPENQRYKGQFSTFVDFQNSALYASTILTDYVFIQNENDLYRLSSIVAGGVKNWTSLKQDLKDRIDILEAFIDDAADVDNIVNKVAEVLKVFENYPEGLNILQELNDIKASILLKANSSDFYTKVQIDNFLNLKADKSTTYTKSEVDIALSANSTNDRNRANHTGSQAISTITDLQTALDGKQNKIYDILDIEVNILALTDISNVGKTAFAKDTLKTYKGIDNAGTLNWQLQIISDASKLDISNVYTEIKDKIIAGSNITLNKDDIAKTITINSTGGGSGGGSTNLAVANKTSTSLDITSDTGTDATIPQATTTEAGLLSANDKVKLNKVEITDNKATDFTTLNNTKYPTTQAVKNELDKKQDKPASATQNSIAIFDNNKNAIDSGKSFGNDGTSNTVPLSNEMQAYVIQQLLNTPDLGSVNVASTANLSLTGLSAIDGYTPVANNLVLAKNQTNTSQNGIYFAKSAAWVRAVFNTTTKAFQELTTETIYSQLNINGGVVNVLNGTAGKNLQFQFSITNPSATFGNSPVFVSATTKIPPRDIFNGFVSNNQGNDTNNNGSPAFPYATISKDLTGASYPHCTTIASNGGSISESITFVSGNSNLTIQSSDTTTDAGKTSLTGQMIFAAGNTRVTLKNTTHSTGANIPFILQSENQTRHKFENLIITTTNPVLFDIDAGVLNWMNLRNLDCGNSLLGTIPLPNFTNPFIINIFNQTRRLPFTLKSGATGLNCTINLFNCPDFNVRIPNGFAGVVNRYDVRKVNEVILNQTRLDEILADTTLNGYYLISGFVPTSFKKGCVFGKQSAGGFTENWLEREFNQEQASIYDFNTKKTYIQENDDWAQYQNGGVTWGGITGDITSQIDLIGEIKTKTIYTIPDNKTGNYTITASELENEVISLANQITTTATFSLANPNNSTKVRKVEIRVPSIGTASVSIAGNQIKTGTSAIFNWNGSAWTLDYSPNKLLIGSYATDNIASIANDGSYSDSGKKFKDTLTGAETQSERTSIIPNLNQVKNEVLNPAVSPTVNPSYFLVLENGATDIKYFPYAPSVAYDGYALNQAALLTIVSSGTVSIGINVGLGLKKYQPISLIVDENNWMTGYISNYNALTGNLSIEVKNSCGSGDHAGWYVTIGKIDFATNSFFVLPSSKISDLSKSNRILRLFGDYTEDVIVADCTNLTIQGEDSAENYQGVTLSTKIIGTFKITKISGSCNRVKIKNLIITGTFLIDKFDDGSSFVFENIIFKSTALIGMSSNTATANIKFVNCRFENAIAVVNDSRAHNILFKNCDLNNQSINKLNALLTIDSCRNINSTFYNGGNLTNASFVGEYTISGENGIYSAINWVRGNSYRANDIVLYQGTLYKANANIPANTAFSVGTSGAVWKCTKEFLVLGRSSNFNFPSTGNFVFDVIQSTSGGWTVNVSTGVVTLKANKTYEVSSSMQFAFSQADAYVGFQLVNNATGVALPGSSLAVANSISRDVNESISSQTSTIITVGTSDINIAVRCVSVFGTATFRAGNSSFIIKEI